MKKTISGLLALLLLLSMCAGCGNNNDPASDQNDPAGPAGENAPAREGQLFADLLGVDPSETALELDGRTIPMELYLYCLTSVCSELEYNLNMYNAYYGLYGEMLNEDGTAKWDADLEGTPLGLVSRVLEVYR